MASKHISAFLHRTACHALLSHASLQHISTSACYLLASAAALTLPFCCYFNVSIQHAVPNPCPDSVTIPIPFRCHFNSERHSGGCREHLNIASTVATSWTDPTLPFNATLCSYKLTSPLSHLLWGCSMHNVLRAMLGAEDEAYTTLGVTHALFCRHV